LSADDRKQFGALIKSMIKPLPGDRARLCSVESILSEMVGAVVQKTQYTTQDEDGRDAFNYYM
jgi:hypothetical protein